MAADGAGPSGPSKTSRVMSVSTQPGATPFTRTPWGASSAASDFVKAMMAPFVAA